jgi:uncharacterized protein (TIGR00375 family)
MRFYADLHIHSKYSRATSKDCDLEHLASWARRKGISVLATGDFTHPAWFEEIRQKLVPAEAGLFRLRPEIEHEVDRRLPPPCRGPVRFMLSVEISTIYKKRERTRKVHHLVYLPDLESADRFRRQLAKIGNIASDGRPILGLDSRDLLEIALQSGEGAFLVPAHVWTPWFAVLGSKSGFDSIEECYGDLASHVFAAETGLSSDPPMNWRVSRLDRYRLISNSDAHSPPMLGREACVFETELDYFALRRALETGLGWGGTLEFFPEEGKYHLDGHRLCGVRLEPEETRKLCGNCPTCGKPVTVGVMHRVEELADRAHGERPATAAPFRSLVPLPEIIGELLGVGSQAASVSQEIASLTGKLGPELSILEELPLETIRHAGSELFAEAVDRLRRGNVIRLGGYDGEYGVIRLFTPKELERPKAGMLFDLPAGQRQAKPRRGPKQSKASASILALPVSSKNETPHPPSVLADKDGARGPELLDALDPDQRAAASIAEGPLLIIAGPGTGKTRTLTYRFAHLIAEQGVEPERCLAITFTRRAADEMRTRLGALLGSQATRLSVTTFHGLGLLLVREQARRLGLAGEPRVVDQAERLGLVQDLFGLSRRDAQRKLDDLSRAARTKASGGVPSELAEAQERYRNALCERCLVDFDDLLTLPVELLESDPELTQKYRSRFQWISIDEYQDIDELQYRFIRLLAPPGGNLCAIGDPDQAIYGFRGADVGFFLRFQQDFPGAHTVRLTRNYRSSSSIITGSMQAISPSMLVRERALTAVSRDETAADRILFCETATERAEAELIVHSIEQLIGGFSHFSLDTRRVGSGTASQLSFADFAVLYRTDAQAAPLVEALARAGIPFQKRSHDRLVDRPGIHGIVERLRGEASGGQGSVRERLRKAVDGRPGGAEVDWASAADLLDPLAERFGNDLDGFLAELALGAEVDTWDPRADRVSLLTFHAAKGLEFPVVFLAGCEDGLLPLRFGAEPCSELALAEERRLFFVGMTRARSHLFLCHARSRFRHGKSSESRPSPFLADIEKALLQRIEGERRPPKSPGPKQLRLL